MLAEYVEVVKSLWATPAGATFSFAGEFYRLADSPALPKPLQVPGPPIIVGGSARGPAGLVAARLGNDLNIQFKTPEEASGEAELLRRRCEEVGRDPVSLSLSVLVGMAAASSVTTSEDANRVRRMGSALIGTPAEIVETVAAYRAAGVDVIYLSLLSSQGVAELTWFAAEVLPLVRHL
jgi:alkanesulfonate monooxygenase SsuD/methylene tetrahydromethanopterin reductase-like flavin-dependent oxidoreductase (luciferase family)